ncbi:iron chelate uptake ABC transporter family permease subunit [Nonomuraea phyllanthi]|uniref:Iron chelate uptake ABC transporter family permease subunit n=1 Tax=Nonomuraea phyllanthi TaxID=2219224 RepID=A0A5C4WK69_9ACTN|nr:iron chelate uptake ABC transporter family permease subunit [Nonomuraea phyllanthi]KAB8194650.1 iron chelate uptake ABC transporter family permease subunit [Nonomuraea phyllanthi]
MRRRPGAALLIVLGLLLLLLSIAAASVVGAAGLSPADVVRTVAAHAGLPVEPLAPLDDGIIWELRLPRVLLAVLVGAGLSVCGAVLQALARNPLADPYLLGISSGASTGAVAVLVLGLGAGAAALSAGAFAGSALAFCCVLAVIGRGFGNTVRVVLAGVMVSQLFSALTSLTVIWAADAQSTRGVTFWLLGSLASASWASAGLCAAVAAAGMLACLPACSALDAFAFGREAAASLGIAPARTELLLFTVTALTTAVLVAASGAIGFVGLIVPHAVRALTGGRHRVLLPACALYGGVFLLAADAVARTAFAPREIPVGMLTALIGVPAFALVLRRTKEARA